MRPFDRSRSDRSRAEPDRLAPGVVGDERVLEVGAVDRPRRVEERRVLTHLLGGAHGPARSGQHRVHRAPHFLRELAHVGQAGARRDQRRVIAGEPLGEPQLTRDVGVLEVERLERRRPNPLHVPGVEELVGDGVEQVGAVGSNRRRRRQHRAVAVLHAVAVGPRQVIGKEGVGVAVEGRELAEDVAGLADDLLHVAREGVQLAAVALVVHGHAELRLPRAVRDHERAQVEGAELRRAVHQVLADSAR